MPSKTFHSYNNAIEEAEIAKDYMWLAGALFGKATAKMAEKYPDCNVTDFDSEIFSTLIQSHQEFGKTKITELEVEISLVICRYLAKFPYCRSRLMDMIHYITKNDLKRLRKREKGNLYLQLADICESAGFSRKQGCFLVLASENLCNHIGDQADRVQGQSNNDLSKIY